MEVFGYACSNFYRRKLCFPHFGKVPSFTLVEIENGKEATGQNLKIPDYTMFYSSILL
jgi:predicted Fe-Mo cluster-binding NifX family protein